MDIWFSVKVYPSADGLTIFYKDVTESKKAGQELLKTLKEVTDYKFALDESSIVAITDHKGIIKYANKNFCKISKYSADDLIGQDHRIINSGYHPKEVIKNLWATIASGKIWKGDLKNKAKDGTIYWVDTTIVPFLDEKGKPYQYVAIRADITERKKVEEELAYSEMHFRSLIENSAEGIALTDEFSNNIYRSPAARKMMGDVPKENTVNLSHPDDRETINGKRAEALNNPGMPVSFQGRFRHAAGQYIWLEGILTNLLHVKGVNAVVTNFRDITQRKEAEERLAISEKRFRSIIEQYPSPIIRYTPEGDFITANPAWETMWEDKIENVTGYNILRDPHMKSSGILKYVEKAFAGEVSLSGIFAYDPLLIGKTGRKRWVQLLMYPLKDNRGNIIEVVVITLDLTENREAQDKLISNEKRFRALIENNYDTISLLNESFNIIYRSPSTFRITGFTNEEVETMDATKNVHPGDLEKVKITLKEVIANPGKPMNLVYRNRHKNGNYIWLDGVITNLLHDKDIKAIVTNFRDVTERIEAEEAILRAEANYREIFDKANDGIYVHEIDTGKVIDVNHRATELNGFSKEELMTGDPHDFLTNHPDYSFEKAISYIQKAAGGEPQFFEWLGKCKDGARSWFEMNLKRTNIGGQDRILAFQRDINDRKKVEAKLLKSEKIYKTIASSIPGSVICLLDLDYRYLLIEGDMLEKLGYSKSKLLGNKAADVLPRELAVTLEKDFERVLKGETIAQESAINGYDIISRFVPLKDENNIVYAIMTAAIDITELKNAQRVIADLNKDLEKKIEVRTEQLKKSNDEL
ncbi:MAG: PAS domain S-box protein, partial [Bacteroidota bacterium]